MSQRRDTPGRVADAERRRALPGRMTQVDRAYAGWLPKAEREPEPQPSTLALRTFSFQERAS